MKSKPAKKAAKTVSQDAPKKVFDVSRPGKMPVSPTSRPVIVGHKPQVKDPMMSDRDERPLMDGNKKVTLQPSAPAVAAAVPTPDADTASSAPTKVLPPSNADSGGLPSANPSLAQEDLRTDTVAGGTDGGAPGAPQPLGEHDGEASMSDRTRTRTPEDEVASAPEVPEAERLAEPSTADSVATIATSSVVDDVPPPQEETTEPAKPVDPMAAGTKTSGLVFDELDGADTPDFTKPSPAAGDTVAGGTDGGAPGAPQPLGEHDGEASMSDRTRTPDEQPVSGQAIVSHHKQSSGAATVLLTLSILLLVAGVIFDILLDLGILNISNIPHTNFFPPN